MNVTIPKGFYDDHAARGLVAPPVINETPRHYVIDQTHPDFEELIDDCAYYCDPNGPERGPWKSAAQGLRRSLEKQGRWTQ